MTEVANIQQLWSELQRCAKLHAEKIAKGRHGWTRMPIAGTYEYGRPQLSDVSKIITDSEHVETVAILGRCDAEEICNRIHWYKFVMNIGLEKKDEQNGDRWR